MSFPVCSICKTPHNPKLAHRFAREPVAPISITIDGKDALKAEKPKKSVPALPVPVRFDDKNFGVITLDGPAEQPKVDRKREPHVRNVEGECLTCKAWISKCNALERMLADVKKKNASRQKKHRDKLRLHREVEAIRKAQKAALKSKQQQGVQHG